MVYFTIDENGVNAGFAELLKGMERNIDAAAPMIGAYVKILLCSYEKEDILVFAEQLKVYSENFKEKIKKIIVKMIGIDVERCKENSMLILDVIK
jgi:hypothetical protein